MIGTLLLLSGIVAGVGLIAAFWQEIQKWLQRVIEKVRVVVKGVIEGSKIFFAKMRGVGKEISKNYAKVGLKWQETIVERTVDINEIPEEYLNKMRNDNVEYEFTNELQNQLQEG